MCFAKECNAKYLLGLAKIYSPPNKNNWVHIVWHNQSYAKHGRYIKQAKIYIFKFNPSFIFNLFHTRQFICQLAKTRDVLFIQRYYNGLTLHSFEWNKHSLWDVSISIISNNLYGSFFSIENLSSIEYMEFKKTPLHFNTKLYFNSHLAI